MAAQDNLAFIEDRKFYKVPEAVEILNWCDDVVRDVFRKEADVVVLANPRPGRRTYRTLLIPGWVIKRVLRRMMVYPRA